MGIEIFFVIILESGKCAAHTGASNSCCGHHYKCGENEGDCDSDHDCQGGLKCGTDNCPHGFANKYYDCCYKPSTGMYAYKGDQILLASMYLTWTTLF